MKTAHRQNRATERSHRAYSPYLSGRPAWLAPLSHGARTWAPFAQRQTLCLPDPRGVSHLRDIHAPVRVPTMLRSFLTPFVGSSRIGHVRLTRGACCAAPVADPRSTAALEAAKSSPSTRSSKTGSLGWLAIYTRQICVGHEFGTPSPCAPHFRPPCRPMLVSRIRPPLRRDMVFSDVRLSDLEAPRHHHRARRLQSAPLHHRPSPSGLSEKVIRGVSVRTHDAFDEARAARPPRDAPHTDGSVLVLTAAIIAVEATRPSRACPSRAVERIACTTLVGRHGLHLTWPPSELPAGCPSEARGTISGLWMVPRCAGS